MMRPRSSSGTMPWSSPLAIAPLRIIVMPIAKQQRVADRRHASQRERDQQRGREHRRDGQQARARDAVAHGGEAERAAQSADAEAGEQQPVAAGTEGEHVARHHRHEREHRRAEDRVHRHHQHQRADVAACRACSASPGRRPATGACAARTGTHGGQLDHEQSDEHRDEAHRVQAEAPRDAESGDDDRGDAGPDDAREIEAARVERDRVGQIVAPDEVDAPATGAPESRSTR